MSDLDRELGDVERWPGLSLDDGQGPAVPRHAAHLDALVDGALRRAVVPNPWWRRKGAAPLIGASVIALSTAAAAAAGLGPRLWAALSSSETEQGVEVASHASGASQAAARGIAQAREPSAVDAVPPTEVGTAGAAPNTGAGQAALGGRAEPVAEATGALEPGRGVAANEDGVRPAYIASGPRNPAPAASAPALQTPASSHEGKDAASRQADGRVEFTEAERAASASPERTLPEPLGAAAQPAVGDKRSLPASDTRATPEDLLGRASALRKAHSYKEALAIYELILTRYPGTRQSSIARVAAAQIELSQLGDARSAQRRFQEAQGDTELGPEALFGLAEACRAQGDSAGERKALNRLLRQHPQSPLASAARKRLASSAAP